MPYLGNEVAPLVQALEGKELKLDSDGDSSITADTDDRVDVKVGGSDIAHVTSTGLGVNTTSPSTALHLKDSDGGILQTVETGDSGNAYLKFINSTTGSGAFSDGFLVGLDTDESATFWLYEGNHMKFATSGTEALRIDANGHITKPLQPAFLLIKTSAQQNFTANGNAHTVTFESEVFDQGNDVASNTFTAPVTGRYQLNVNMGFNQIDSGANYFIIYIHTSNKKYFNYFDPSEFNGDLEYFSMNMSVLADMDANDTAVIEYLQSGGASQVDGVGGSGDSPSNFSGYLVC